MRFQAERKYNKSIATPAMAFNPLRMRLYYVACIQLDADDDDNDSATARTPFTVLSRNC